MVMARSGSKDPEIGTLLPLSRATDPAIAGRKASTLAVLKGHEFPVPDGWVAPPGTAERLARGEVDPALLHELEQLPAVPLAVRSSGIAEDTEEASFAGQYESLLNICGTESLLSAIKQVWKSGQAMRVHRYLADLGLANQNDSLPAAVLIQPMLEADRAGVAFTANPVTGDRDEIVVNAVSGLGDRLMSGELDAETWVVRNSAISDSPSEAQVLNRAQVSKIAALAREVEVTLGGPQDIEWAIVGEDLFVLQARPITALPVKPEFPDPPPGTWIKETEHFTTQTSVMQASLYPPAFESATKAAFGEFGTLVDRLRIIDRCGELYIQPVPLGERFGPPPPGWLLGLFTRLEPGLRKRIRACRTAFEGRRHEQLVERWYTEWKDDLRSRGQQLVSFDLLTLTDQALADHAASARKLFRDGAHVHFSLSVPTILFPYDLVTVCREIFGWDDTESLMLIAETASASSAPVRALDDLVHAALDRPGVRDVMSRPDVTVDLIRDMDAGYGEMIDQYLHDFGHRSLDNEISMPTLFERSDLVLDLLRERIESKGTSANTQSVQEAQREKANELLRLRSETDRHRFQAVLDLAARTNAVREEKVLFTMYLPISIIRYTMLEAGRRLAVRGHVARTDDVFYLSFDEVLEALVTKNADDLKHKVSTRRAERAWVAANPGPQFVGDPPSMPDPSWLPEPARTLTRAFAWHFSEEKPFANGVTESALRGIPASSGRYRGPVRVMRDQSDFHRLEPGDVLVCSVTTSAWGILFGRAGALVTDHGGVLSHPAIAAREHGLPSVVGTVQATSVLKDGQIVTVDGSRGVVEFDQSR